MQITLRQSSSAGARIHVSCGLCRLMKPVLMPTSVHLAFQFRFLAVPMCLYLSQISQPMALSNCVSYGFDVFPCHASA
ncbi:chloroplastic,Mechanosensitive ion channel protein 3 [Trichinella spiralis]|uniref:Chloroplastic,Mechanosensitive ion channel protein 3 n=1 Tax=Trichinella spiralis TaxID=6334 RepID=A0ABR3KRK5_TRISP